MNKRWTSSKTIKFLEAYERNSCLWDVDSPDYTNYIKRCEAYEKLASVMDIENFDVVAVKAKIRSIRNAYSFERSKIISSKYTDEVYKPKLVWFPIADRILRDVVHTKKVEPTECKTENVVCILIYIIIIVFLSLFYHSYYGTFFLHVPPRVIFYIYITIHILVKCPVLHYPHII